MTASYLVQCLDKSFQRANNSRHMPILRNNGMNWIARILLRMRFRFWMRHVYCYTRVYVTYFTIQTITLLLVITVIQTNNKYKNDFRIPYNNLNDFLFQPILFSICLVTFLDTLPKMNQFSKKNNNFVFNCKYMGK